MSKRARALWIMLVAVLAAGGAGAAWVAKKNQAERANKDKAVVLEFVAADVISVEAHPLRQVLAVSGTLQPVNLVVVKAKVSGAIATITPREGEQVSARQILARFDTADLEARLAEKAGNLAAGKAQLALAEKNRQLQRKLLDQKFISQNAFDSTESSYLASKGTVESWEAQVRLARNQLDDAVVRAPIAGTVARRHVQPGEKVNVDAPLLTVVDLARLEVQAPVPASDVPAIRLGMPVKLRVDGIAERVFAGRVERINPVTETGTRTILVYLSVDNSEALLRGGMFAQGEVGLRETTAVPTLPVRAIRTDDNRQYVWVIAGGKLARRAVVLGERDAATERVEVRSGVDSGDTILAGRFDNLREGAGAIVKTTAPATAPAVPPKS